MVMSRITRQHSLSPFPVLTPLCSFKNPELKGGPDPANKSPVPLLCAHTKEDPVDIILFGERFNSLQVDAVLLPWYSESFCSNISNSF